MNREFTEKYSVILTYHTVIEPCKYGNCWICAVINCPHHNPAHYSKGGCPSCQKALFHDSDYPKNETNNVSIPSGTTGNNRV